MSLNKVQIIGFLGDNPRITEFQTGAKLAAFSVATSTKRKDKQGRQIEDTEWHRILCWSYNAEYVGKYFHKGTQCYLEGKLKTRSYERNGLKLYTTEIVADEVQLLDRIIKQINNDLEDLPE